MATNKRLAKPKNKVMQIRITQEIYERLLEKSEVRGVAVSEIVRTAISEFIEKSK